MNMLNVVIHVEYSLGPVDASKYIDHPSNIARSKRIDEIKSTILNDIVESALQNINYRKFKILQQYQSKKGYSYYIELVPITKDNQKLGRVLVKFRISDHKMKGSEGLARPKVRIRSFELNSGTYNNSFDLIEQIDEICESLYNGDTSLLEEYL